MNTRYQTSFNNRTVPYFQKFAEFLFTLTAYALWLTTICIASYYAVGIFSEGGLYLYAALANNDWASWPNSVNVIGFDTRILGRGIPLSIAFLLSKIGNFSSLTLSRIYSATIFGMPVLVYLLLSQLSKFSRSRVQDHYLIAFIVFGIPPMMFSATEAYVCANIFWILISVELLDKNALRNRLLLVSVLSCMLICTHESGIVYLTLAATRRIALALDRTSLKASIRKAVCDKELLTMALFLVTGVALRLAKDLKIAAIAKAAYQNDTATYFSQLSFGTNSNIRMGILILSLLVIYKFLTKQKIAYLILLACISPIAFDLSRKIIFEVPNVDQSVAGRPWILIGNSLVGAFTLFGPQFALGRSKLLWLTKSLLIPIVLLNLLTLHRLMNEWNRFRVELTRTASTCSGLHRYSEFNQLMKNWGEYYNLRYGPVTALIQGPSVTCIIDRNRENPDESFPQRDENFKPGYELPSLRSTQFFKFSFLSHN